MKNTLILLQIVFLITGCTGIYEDGKELAQAIKPTVDQISVDDLKTKMENDEAFYLIDVRTGAEYEEGFINDEYAYNMYLKPVILPRGVLEFKIDDPIYWEDFFEDVPDKETTEIVVYCQNGDRGLLAANTLLKLGYKNVKNLEGGYARWLDTMQKEAE